MSIAEEFSPDVASLMVFFIYASVLISLVLSMALLLAGIGLIKRAAWGGGFALVFSFLRFVWWIFELTAYLLIVLHIPGDGEKLIAACIAAFALLLKGILPVVNLIIGIQTLKRGGVSNIHISPLPPETGHLNDPEGLTASTEIFSRRTDTISVQEIRNSAFIREHKLDSLNAFKEPIRNFVGRDPDCQLTITGDRYVSGKHCMLMRDEHGNYILSDVGSSEGTFLLRDHKKIRLSSPMPIFSGDTVLIGSTKLIFSFLSTN
ncbi:MAG: FHA domain-containing protein [Lentisphaeria bacterium]|nr:FHA domain-containing protein [Lentisphaeria bacterium]